MPQRKPFDKKERARAKLLLKGIKAAKERAEKSPKANLHYWNGDTWGSISGWRDAEEWKEDQVLNYICQFIRRERARKCTS